MRKLSLLLWPIHYGPLPDELLSCWLVRLAHGHGLKVQTFCNALFGNNHQVWNRDVDRLAPEWLVDELSLHTGTSLAKAYETTLRPYEGLLYERSKASGTLPWIQSLRIYHRKREGFGLQFCGACLAEGTQLYFRKRWRVAFNTICVKHHRMLHDRCPACGAGVAFHRMDVGHGSTFDDASLAMCHACSFNLAEAPVVPVACYNTDALAWHEKRCAVLENRQGSPRSAIDIEEMRVLHQLVTILLSPKRSIGLRQHVCEQLGIVDLIELSGRVSIESRPLKERHFIIQLGAWLMLDLEVRLRQAWLNKAVRYNQLLKDFDRVPSFYTKVFEKFLDPRRKQSGLYPSAILRAQPSSKVNLTFHDTSPKCFRTARYLATTRKYQ